MSGTPHTDDGLIEIPLVGHRFRYQVRVDLSGAAPRLTELRIIADDTGGIDPSTMKNVPVRRITAAAARFITHADGAFIGVDELHEPNRLTRPERSASRHLDDRHYRRVAAALMKARREGALSPRHAVAEQMGDRRRGVPIPLATLDRWIAEAKRRGYLRRDWRTTTELEDTPE
ncbi:hypothetical protein C5E43_27670 [Nocardia cyriacigeorgica]|nr:hypothetical protein C5B73_27520 [Nocardia cyriacigeorgica]PPJ01925.1 hypothetical protein C5E43_27670 [Nocardia cyriacigeorgica]